jgi:hypothetical protein
MPDEVRAEIGPYFNGRSAITDEQSEKLAKPGSAPDGGTMKQQFIRKGLTVSRTTMLCFLVVATVPDSQVSWLLSNANLSRNSITLSSLDGATLMSTST